MVCPNCGSSEARPIAPGYVECVATLESYFDVGNGTVGMARTACNTRYAKGNADLRFGVCKDCTTGAVRTCTDCHAPLCGDCGYFATDWGHTSGSSNEKRQWVCRDCRNQRSLAAKERSRRLRARRAAEYRALPGASATLVERYLRGEDVLKDGTTHQLWDWTCDDIGRVLQKLGITEILTPGYGWYGTIFQEFHPSGRVTLSRGAKNDGDTGRLDAPEELLDKLDGQDRFNRPFGDPEDLTGPVYTNRLELVRDAIQSKARSDKHAAIKKAQYKAEETARRIKLTLVLLLVLALPGSCAYVVLFYAP